MGHNALLLFRTQKYYKSQELRQNENVSCDESRQAYKIVSWKPA